MKIYYFVLKMLSWHDIKKKLTNLNENFLKTYCSSILLTNFKSRFKMRINKIFKKLFRKLLLLKTLKITKKIMKFL